MRSLKIRTQLVYRRKGLGCFYVNKRTSVVAMATHRSSYNWLDPRWNWGYAVGTAHDAAFELRNRLRTQSQRENFISNASDDEKLPWDELQLCLALRIQRSVNFGRDPANFGQVLDDMARGEFGEGTQPNGKLIEALRSRLDQLDGAVEAEDDRATAVQTLITLGFLQDGL